MDASDFCARSRLSRLRFLDLYGNLRISSWDRLASRTTLLTTLSLKLDTFLSSPILTTSQLFSILTSNPNLQELHLYDSALPGDTKGSTPIVGLHDLKFLSLMGEFHRLFGLLRQLILPEALDEMHLTVFNPTVEDVS